MQGVNDDNDNDMIMIGRDAIANLSPPPVTVTVTVGTQMGVSYYILILLTFAPPARQGDTFSISMP